MRRGWLVLGVSASLLGLASLIRDDLASHPLVSEAILLILGFLAITATVIIIVIRVIPFDESPATTESVEQGPQARVPGDVFDEVLAAKDMSPYIGEQATTNRAYVRSVLRSLVTNTLELERNKPPEQAAENLSDGSWTDDPVAAWFVSDAGPTPPEEIQSECPTNRSLNEYATRRTLAAIIRVREEDDWQASSRERIET